MKKGFIKLTILIFTLICTSTVFAADVAKIGVVNFERIIKESSAGKVNQQQLKAKHKEIQKKLEDKTKAIKEMALALDREALVLSAEKKRDRQREIRDSSNELKAMKSDLTQEFQILQNKKLGMVEKDVFEIANALGKEGGYLLILERKISGVIYMPSQIDITDQIIKKYNEKFAQKK
jgi:outer membrane protein